MLATARDDPGCPMRGTSSTARAWRSKYPQVDHSWQKPVGQQAGCCVRNALAEVVAQTSITNQKEATISARGAPAPPHRGADPSSFQRSGGVGSPHRSTGRFAWLVLAHGAAAICATRLCPPSAMASFVAASPTCATCFPTWKPFETGGSPASGPSHGRSGGYGRRHLGPALAVRPGRTCTSVSM